MPVSHSLKFLFAYLRIFLGARVSLRADRGRKGGHGSVQQRADLRNTVRDVRVIDGSGGDRKGSPVCRSPEFGTRCWVHRAHRAVKSRWFAHLSPGERKRGSGIRSRSPGPLIFPEPSACPSLQRQIAAEKTSL